MCQPLCGRRRAAGRDRDDCFRLLRPPRHRRRRRRAADGSVQAAVREPDGAGGLTSRAKLADQCLWLKHVEDGQLKDALASVHPGSVIRLLVDGQPIDFQRMATGKDGRITNGFNPVGERASEWRSRYSEGDHLDIVLDFAPI